MAQADGEYKSKMVEMQSRKEADMREYWTNVFSNELIDRMSVIRAINDAYDESSDKESYRDNVTQKMMAISSAEPTCEQVEEYCAKRCLTLVSNEFMAHIIADSGRSLRAGRLEDVLDKIKEEIEQAADKQFQIAMGIADLNERYSHLKMENAYRHSLNIIDRYREGESE